MCYSVSDTGILGKKEIQTCVKPMTFTIIPVWMLYHGAMGDSSEYDRGQNNKKKLTLPPPAKSMMNSCTKQSAPLFHY